MKKILLGVICSASLALILASQAYAQDQSIPDVSENITSKAIVGYQPSDEVTNPLNPVDPTLPVSPENPDGTKPDPGTAGDLSIDYVSSLDFGLNQISNQDQTYYAQAQRYANSSLLTPNFVQVTDNRGTLAGWTLKVEQTSQFYSANAPKYKTLDGASVSFLKPVNVSNGTSEQPNSSEVINLVPGVEALVTQANPGTGAGTWITRWGDENDLFQKTLDTAQEKIKTTYTPDVTLFVPGATPKDPVNYNTHLVWILSELPANN